MKSMVTETQIFYDFLIKQLPVIIVLSIFCYCMYKYFTQVIKDQKDEIKDLHRQLLELTKQSIEAQNNSNEAFNGLKDTILMVQRTMQK